MYMIEKNKQVWMIRNLSLPSTGVWGKIKRILDILTYTTYIVYLVVKVRLRANMTSDITVIAKLKMLTLILTIFVCIAHSSFIITQINGWKKNDKKFFSFLSSLVIQKACKNRISHLFIAHPVETKSVISYLRHIAYFLPFLNWKSYKTMQVKFTCTLTWSQSS